MPIGAGGAPAGVAAAGYGLPDLATVPNNAVLPDLRTGLPQSGRAIDPVSKSYTFLPDGRLRGMATVPQLVQLALTTVRGSSCQSNLGQTFTSIQEKSSNFEQQITAEINLALDALVKSKQAQIVAVTVQSYPSSPDAGLAQVTWLDLTTGVQSVTTVGP